MHKVCCVVLFLIFNHNDLTLTDISSPGNQQHEAVSSQQTDQRPGLIDKNATNTIKYSVRTISKEVTELEKRDEAKRDADISEMYKWAYDESKQSQYSGEQMNRIKEYARRKDDQAALWANERRAQLESSAVALEKSYLNTNNAASVTLNPLATNIYVRNYQAVNNLSGNSTAILATPSKLLVDHKLNNKTKH